MKRGDIYWVTLDPTVGTEIQKTRPCLIISPDDMNYHLPRVLIAPITSKGQLLGCRPEFKFNNKSSRILLDQIRCVDKSRLQKKSGSINLDIWHATLIEMLS